MNKYDIIVAGGGFAGAAAAISAARLGKSVLLFENANCLGGAAANCLINPFMPNSTKINENRVELSAGIFTEICTKLKEFRKLTGEHHNEEYGNIFSEEHLKIILNRMMAEAGVELLFHAVLCSVDCFENKLKNVTVATKSGNIQLYADYFIDATGDAELAFRAGCGYRLGREEDNLCQPMTLCFRVANVDVVSFYQELPVIQKLYARCQREGKIKNPREDILVFRLTQKNVLHFNSTRIVKLDPTNPFDITRAEIEAREQVLELYLFLKDNAKSFKDAELFSTASQIGVRESRMIDGEYFLTGKELVNCARFKDSIACGNYDIDIHNPEGSGTSHHFFSPGEYYEIPYRSLVPKAVTNLLVAGRCISVDHEAQASIRIMPIVCCIGEAAGVAAAVSAEDMVNVADVDIKSVQEILVENGAVIHVKRQN